jgi:hypothetical protein
MCVDWLVQKVACPMQTDRFPLSPIMKKKKKTMIKQQVKYFYFDGTMNNIVAGLAATRMYQLCASSSSICASSFFPTPLLCTNGFPEY